MKGPLKTPILAGRVPWLVGLVLALTGGGASRAQDPPVRLREIYVPYPEFQALTESNPHGMVMTLKDYREMVLRAVENARKEPPPPLPPLEATVIEARYQGAVHEKTARFEGVLKIRVAGEGWVRCDLGAPLPGLGSIVVDDAPGWVVVEKARAFLLLRGKGEHRVDLVFSLPVTESEDRYTMEGPIVPAAGARLELNVPGEVDASSDPPALETVRNGGDTRLVLAAGTASRCRLEWRRKKILGERAVFLSANHLVTYVLRQDNPVFRWDVTVTVARQKTDTLLFEEPPSTRVLRLEGPLVHGWERTEAGLQVLLKEPTMGSVQLHFSGILLIPGETYTLGAPSLEGSFSNTGHLALYEPGGGEITVTDVTAITESSPGDAGPLPELQSGEGAGVRPRIGRLYAFTSPEASVTATVTRQPVRFESRGSFLTRITDTTATIDGVLRLDVREGRVYRLTLDFPPPWTPAGITEFAGEGRTLHHIHQEEVEGENGSRQVDLTFGRAAVPGEPVEFKIRMENATFFEEGAWERKDITIVLPRLEGAEKSRYDLGVYLAPSMDALMADVPGWRSLAPEEIREMDLDAPEGKMPGELVAGLTTREPEARLGFTLVHRRARGEYRSVTHVLALERMMRVRVDVRLTAVDRPIESLILELPPQAGPSTVILSTGIKEIRTVPDTPQREIRFSKPWLGTRQLRIEYEIPLGEGSAVTESSVPVPDLALDTPEADGAFGSQRFLVLQSQGPVEIRDPGGEGLTPVDVDDMPDFAEPWEEGRVLTAFRFQANKDPGILRTIVHARAPVLAQLAREMKLTTVLGLSGVSRTRAEILLAYSRQQHFTVELPEDASCLAVVVDGNPIRSVILPSGDREVPASEAGRTFGIPLPPQSYASVTITYERPGPEALGAWGTWRERGPLLKDIPVGEVTWSVYHPKRYLFFIRGENVRALDPDAEEQDTDFLSSFLGRLLQEGELRLTTFVEMRPAGKEATVPDLTPEEARGAQSSGAAPVTQQGRIQPRSSSDDRFATAQKTAAPLYELIPEGLEIDAWKLGGSPRLELFYSSTTWWTFSKRTLFWGALLTAWLLFLRPRKRVFWSVALWGLFLGTAVPVVLGWKSPLLLVPLCEGLLVALVLLGAASALGWLFRRLRERRSAGVQAAGGAAAAAVVLLVLSLFSQPLPAQEKPTEKASGEAIQLPTDGVLIPYDPDKLPGSAGAGEKVYIPYGKFRELWRLAYPDEPDEEKAPPEDLVLGNAEYTLKLDSETCRILATIRLRVLTDRWIRLPLPFDRANLVRIRLDGNERGVEPPMPGPDGKRPADAIPSIALRGAGAHVLDLELMVDVHTDLGEYKVLTGLMAGAAATLRAELPAGAKVEARRAPGGQSAAGEAFPLVVTQEPERTRLTADLGGADRIELVWSFPKVEGQMGSQVESLSYSRLDLSAEGYTIQRSERVRVTGRPVDSLEYLLEGDWQVTEVRGADVSEWSVLSDVGAPVRKRLQVFFAKPVDSAQLEIAGVARLEDAAPLATLALSGAVKQETYVGLRHARLRKFRPDVLSGMQRAASQDLAQRFRIAPDASPDRIYHAYGSASGEMLAVERVETRADVDTEIVLVIEPDRLVLTARSRYTVSGPGPLRHEVPLPAGWSVRNVKCDALREWEVLEDGTAQRLVIAFENRAGTGTEILWSAERLYSSAPETLELPPLRATAVGVTTLRENSRWIFAANDELDISVTDPGSLVPLRLKDAIPQWVALPPLTSYRDALRSSRAEDPGEAPTVLAISRETSQLSATVVSFVRLTELHQQVNARVTYRIRKAGRDRFRLALPAGARLVSLETRNQRSREVRQTPTGTEIEIVLQSGVVGEHPVDVAYRVARPAGRQTVVLPIQVLDGEERLTVVDQYVGVVQTTATLLSAPSAQGLRALEAERLPYLPEGVSSANLRPTYRATQLDWRLELTEVITQVTLGPAATIQIAELTTIVGIDGTARTRVTYTLKNTGLQFLVVDMPEGTELWGVTLNGRSVAVGEDAGTAPGEARSLRIPVEYVGSASLNLEVAIQYEEQDVGLPALRGTETLRAPRVRDTAVTETIWNIHFPDGYWVHLSDGNMREVAASLQYERRVQNLLEQFDRISQAARETDSRRVQEQAQREVARLEQTLGDNLAELQSTNRSFREQAQSERLGQEVLEEQWRRNTRVIEKSQKVQQDLREARRARQEEPEQAMPPSRQEQAFVDTGNFLKQSWRGGKQALPSEGPPAGQAAPPGARNLEALLDDSPFRGLQGVTVPPLSPDVEQAQPQPLERGRGLKPLPESVTAGAAPGLEAQPEARGAATYTFQRTGGDAEIIISFTRRDTGPRLAALLLLLAVPLFIGWRAWRRRGR